MKKWYLKKGLLNKISGLVILLAGSATVNACYLFFNEVEIPEKLKKEVKF